MVVKQKCVEMEFDALQNMFMTMKSFTPMRCLNVETLGGIKEVDLDVEGGEVIASSKVDMGVATFNTPEIPMISEKEEVFEEELDVAGKPLKMTAVNVGNPHAVIFSENLDEYY